MVVRRSALQRSGDKNAAAGYLWSDSACSTDRDFSTGKNPIRIQRSQASKGFAKGKARFPFDLFCFLLQEQKEVPAGQAQNRILPPVKCAPEKENKKSH